MRVPILHLRTPAPSLLRVTGFFARTWVLVVAVAMLLHASASVAADGILGEQPTTETLTSSEHFALHGLPSGSKWATSLLEMGETIYARQTELFPSDHPPRIQLVWVDREDEFLRRIQAEPHGAGILAVAFWSHPVIVFNGQRARREGLGGIRQTFEHEMVHIYVARNMPDGIPRWLNEGLAMGLSFESDYQPTFLSALRNQFGALPSLGDLADQFPGGQEPTREAYMVSQLATRHLKQTRYHDWRAMLEALERPGAAAEFYKPEVWIEIDAGYRRQYLSPVATIGLAFVSGAFWGGIGGLALLAALLFRRRYVKRKAVVAEQDSMVYASPPPPEDGVIEGDPGYWSPDDPGDATEYDDGYEDDDPYIDPLVVDVPALYDEFDEFEDDEDDQDADDSDDQWWRRN